MLETNLTTEMKGSISTMKIVLEGMAVDTSYAGLGLAEVEPERELMALRQKVEEQINALTNDLEKVEAALEDATEWDYVRLREHEYDIIRAIKKLKDLLT